VGGHLQENKKPKVAGVFAFFGRFFKPINTGLFGFV